MSAAAERIDDVIRAAGYGWWQVPILLATLVVNMVPIHYMISTFINAPLPFRCHYHNSTLSYSSNEDVLDALKNSTYFNNECLAPFEVNLLKEEAKVSKVHLLRHHTGLPSCPEIEYDTTVYSTTVISEFDLVCERAWLRPLYQIMVTVGAILGCWIGGSIGDAFGRRRAMQIASLVAVPACTAVGLVPWFPLVLVLRVLVGFSVRCSILSCVNLAMETCPPRQRTVLGMAMGVPYSAATLLFALAGYYVRDWRCLQMICSLPFIVVAPLTLMVDESPRWLVQNGRGEEAAAILERAATKNGVDLPLNLTALLHKMKEESRSSMANKKIIEASYKPLKNRLKSYFAHATVYMRSPALMTILVATPIMYFLMCVLYNGILFNVNNFTSTNPFLYVAMLSMLEIVSIMAATPLTGCLGRKAFVVAALFISGVLYMLELVVPQDYWYVKWGLVMASFFFIGAGYQVNFLYVPELFPTVIRTKGFGLVALTGSLGQIVSPLIIELLGQYSKWAVGIALGSAGLLSSLLVPLLPETNKKPLPDTVQDVEDRKHSRNLYAPAHGDDNNNAGNKLGKGEVVEANVVSKSKCVDGIVVENGEASIVTDVGAPQCGVSERDLSVLPV